MYIFIIRVGGILILKKITIDLYEEEVNYLLTGLELFVLNLQNIWAVKKDAEENELRYTTVFYLYERLLDLNTNYDKYVTIKMQKPKKVSKKVLNFFK